MGTTNSRESSSATQQVQPLYEYRNLQQSHENYDIPELSHKRKITDKPFLILFGVFFLILFAFLGYTLYFSNILRLANGYDQCGNICGIQNEPVDGIACSGVDETEKRFLLPKTSSSGLIENKCVESCPKNTILFLNRCFRDNNADDRSFSDRLNELKNDINKSSGQIVGICSFGLAMCLVMVLLFRYFIGFIVWFSLIAGIMAINGVAAVFWFLYAKVGQPFTCLMIQISTAGFLTEIGPSITSNEIRAYYDYFPDSVMLVTKFFTILMTIWMAYFITGCQYMVISGAVAASFFAKNKKAVSPIYTSFYNLTRFHLGTVAIGSLIITIVNIIEVLLKILTRKKSCNWLIVCFRFLEKLLKYLSKNAYIQTALHGQSFWKSGKRAVNLLVANASTAILMNFIANFIIFVAKLWIIGLTVIFCFIIKDDTVNNYYVAILTGTFVTALLAHCFFTVFETAVDTVFLCYCEDCCMNDGETRPYYMTTDMMLIFQETKVLYANRQN